MRQYLPKSWKLLYQLLRRYCREHLFSKLQFALKHQALWQADQQISTQQSIKINHYFENKTHNIDLAIEALNGLVIEPNLNLSRRFEGTQPRVAEQRIPCAQKFIVRQLTNIRLGRYLVLTNGFDRFFLVLLNGMSH